MKSSTLALCRNKINLLHPRLFNQTMIIDIVPDNLIVREDGEVITTVAESVTYMDIAPNQMISVAASLVPFLENDDANRALDGIKHAASGRTFAGDLGPFSWNRNGEVCCQGFRSLSAERGRWSCRGG